MLDTAEWLEGQGVEVVRLPVGSDGLVDLDMAEAAIDDRTALVAVMLVNNEIGVIQPVAEIAQIAHEAGALMLCDAVQGFGRMAIPEGPDLVAISGHKIHGPKGIGALWMREGARAGAVAPRRRAGAGAALGHAVAGAVRRLRRGGATGGRAARGGRRHVAKLWSWRWRSSARLDRQRQRWSSAIAAISTSAATGSTAPG